MRGTNIWSNTLATVRRQLLLCSPLLSPMRTCNYTLLEFFSDLVFNLQQRKVEKSNKWKKLTMDTATSLWACIYINQQTKYVSIRNRNRGSKIMLGGLKNNTQRLNEEQWGKSKICPFFFCSLKVLLETLRELCEIERKRERDKSVANSRLFNFSLQQEDTRDAKRISLIYRRYLGEIVRFATVGWFTPFSLALRNRYGLVRI